MAEEPKTWTKAQCGTCTCGGQANRIAGVERGGVWFAAVFVIRGRAEIVRLKPDLLMRLWRGVWLAVVFVSNRGRAEIDGLEPDLRVVVAFP